MLEANAYKGLNPFNYRAGTERSQRNGCSRRLVSIPSTTGLVLNGRGGDAKGDDARLNPFNYRAGTERPRRRRTPRRCRVSIPSTTGLVLNWNSALRRDHPTGLNPFNYRAGTEPDPKDPCHRHWRLNPFNYRAGTELYLSTVIRNAAVSIPSTTGLVLNHAHSPRHRPARQVSIPSTTGLVLNCPP